MDVLLIVVVFGLFLSGVVKGATGIGYASSALPFLALAIEFHHAIVVALVPAMATNIAVALFNGYFVELLSRFRMLYLSMLPGIATGAVVLSLVDHRIAGTTLGVTIIFYSAFALVRSDWTLPKPAIAALQLPVGFSNGVITGLTGSQVMPLIPFLMAAALTPARLTQAINLGVTLASLAVILSMVALETVEADILLPSMLAIPPAILGVLVGGRLRSRLSAERFKVVLLVVLAVCGAVLIARNAVHFVL